MSQPVVLLVEDEPAQRSVLSYNLKAEGFQVVEADNGEDVLLLTRENLPDLIVLDWMIPQVSGIEVCRRLKVSNDTKSIPIIMLSARSEELDRVRGLETGADDYVVKPYSVIELIARVKAQLRRLRAAAVGEKLSYDDIRLDGETHKVFRSDTELKLGPTEFRLLSTFMENRGVYGRASSFWTGFGVEIYMWIPALLMYTSVVYAKHFVSSAEKILCARYVVQAMPWARSFKDIQTK